VRLIDGADVKWRDRGHFYAVAANVMRRLSSMLPVRASPGNGAAARPGPATRRRSTSIASRGRGLMARTLCAFDDALTALARFDPPRARAVALRFFGGLTVEEMAQVLDTSPQAVMRD
jgi:hypothetical protein